MSKYLLKFTEYILPSSKDCTGVGLLSYRDAHSSSISGEDIDIVLSIELVLKSKTQLTKTYYYKRATANVGILCICKDTQPSLLVISDSPRSYLYQKLTDGFCSLKLACILGEFFSGRFTEATAKLETETATCRSWVVWLMMRFSISSDGLGWTAGTLTGARSLIAKAEIEVETWNSSWTV